VARPVLASKGTASIVTTNAPAPTYPASVVANDIVILEVVKYDGTATATIGTPAGFTLITSQILLDSAFTQVGLVSWFYRRATGALSGTVTVTCTGGTGNATIALGQMYRVTGCATTGNPFDNFIGNHNGVVTGSEAVKWSAFKEYHSAEQLPILLAAGAGAGLTQPPATPTGVTATTAADSTTTGADAFVLAYTQTTPADGTNGPFTSATSRASWATLAINFISASYVHSAISGTDANGTTTEASSIGLVGKDDYTSAATFNATNPGGNSVTGASSSSNLDNTRVNDGALATINLSVGGDAAFLHQISHRDTNNGGTDTPLPAGAIVTSVDVRVVFTSALSGVNWTVILSAPPGGTGIDSNPQSLTDPHDTTTQDQTILNIDSGLTNTTIQDFAGGNWTALVEIDISNTSGFSRSATIDYVQVIVHYSLVTANSVESGSVTVGGGSTPKSGSDSNGTATETGSPVGVHASADVNGTVTETGSPVGVHAATDTGGDSENGLVTVPIAGADTNGATTEATVEHGAYTQTDTNGTTTEAVISTGVYSVTDANGVTTEITITGLVATDANGVTTEASIEHGAYTQSDANGATTESATETYLTTATDVNGVTSEITVEVAVESGSDANGATTENSNVTVPISGTDTNSTTTENTTLGVLPSADTDTESEASTLKAAYTQADAGTDNENSIETAAYTVSDADATPTEVSTLKVALTFTDFNSSGENATLGAVLPVSDASTLVGEVGVLAVVYTLVDSNTETEAFVVKAVIAVSEINSTSTDAGSVTGNGTTSVSGTDAGTSSATASLTAAENSGDSGASTDTPALAARFFVPEAPSATESYLLGLGVSEAGSGADSGVESVLWLLSDAATGSMTAVMAARITALDFGAGIETSSMTAVLVAALDSGIGSQNGLISLTDGDFGFGFDDVPNVTLFLGVDFGTGSDSSRITKWPYFPDTPPEIIVATELESAVLVGVGLPAADLVATESETPVVEISQPRKPSITRVGTDQPRIERTR
jgi:hypothetical protein